MTNAPRLLLWTDAAPPYIDAIREAGLADRVVIETLGRNAKLSDAQRAHTEVLLAAIVPPGLLPGMPKLRWAQALTAGVEGWLALPDLPSHLTLTCARGTHREVDAGEHHRCAVLRRQARYAASAQDQKHSKWTNRVAEPLNGKTLGILGLGAIGQEVARIASALGMHVIGTRRRPQPLPGIAAVLPRNKPPKSWRNRTSLCCCCHQRRTLRISSTPSAWER